MAPCLTPLWPGIGRAQESRVTNLGFLKFLLFSGHLDHQQEQGSREVSRAGEWKLLTGVLSMPRPTQRLPPWLRRWPAEARGPPVVGWPRTGRLSDVVARVPAPAAVSGSPAGRGPCVPPRLQALLPCSSGHACRGRHLDLPEGPSDSLSRVQTQLTVWLGLLHPNLLALASLVTAHVRFRFPGCVNSV